MSATALALPQSRSPFYALIAGAVLALGVLASGSNLGADEHDADAIAAMEGGTPLPAGVHNVQFPSMAKQSISFVSDAAERIAGVVEFNGEGALGSAVINVDEGSGSGSLSVAVAQMRTGSSTRDEHLVSEGWMDAANHPEITFSIDALKKLSDTVWEVTGTWTIKGQSKQMTSLANLRFIPTFPNFGDNIVRVRTSFDIPIKEFGITHEAVGSPAVAEIWNVDLVLLGQVTDED